MFNKTLHRPMFRKGGSTGSAGTGITSGLQAPRQGYDGDDGSFVSKLESTNAIDNYLKNNREQNNTNLGNLGNMTIDQMRAKSIEAFPDRKRSNKDLFIDFGLDLVSRPGSGGSIFENIGASGQKAYNQYRKTNTAADNKLDDRRSDLFTSLIGAQAKMRGSEAAGKSYESTQKALKVRELLPRFLELKGKRKEGRKTGKVLTNEEVLELRGLQEDYNAYRKSDPSEDIIREIFVKGKGDKYLSKKMKELFLEDIKQGVDRKYKGEKYTIDPQVERDAVEAIKIELEELPYADGGRAGYANGELVEEQVTETMDPGPMGGQNMNTDNPISYDQLRARLPAEITDDIVTLIANSAEALEDFAMISDQSQVDQFNRKYSVNLVLPAEA